MPARALALFAAGLACLLTVSSLLVLTPGASANTSHAGWPQITGLLLMNKRDQSRPLDGRPGHDPFDATDGSYSCDGLHNSACFPKSWWQGPVTICNAPGACAARTHSGPVVPANIGHNELLGGHGNNTIHAGPAGDVIWGDYKPSGDPTTQVNTIYGGPGNDIIYAAHGANYISTGGGVDIVHAHFGHGVVLCNSSTVTVFVSHQSLRRYRLIGCRHRSF
jgi:Ca2+-binding RTX toxin-like protein